MRWQDYGIILFAVLVLFLRPHLPGLIRSIATPNAYQKALLCTSGACHCDVVRKRKYLQL